MTVLTPAELAAALRISTKTVQRHVADGMPYQPSGARGKRFVLADCQQWLKERYPCPSQNLPTVRGMSRSASIASEYTDACRRQHLRVLPSNTRPI